MPSRIRTDARSSSRSSLRQNGSAAARLCPRTRMYIDGYVRGWGSREAEPIILKWTPLQAAEHSRLNGDVGHKVVKCSGAKGTTASCLRGRFTFDGCRIDAPRQSGSGPSKEDTLKTL